MGEAAGRYGCAGGAMRCGSHGVGFRDSVVATSDRGSRDSRVATAGSGFRGCGQGFRAAGLRRRARVAENCATD